MNAGERAREGRAGCVTASNTDEIGAKQNSDQAGCLSSWLGVKTLPKSVSFGTSGAVIKGPIHSLVQALSRQKAAWRFRKLYGPVGSLRPQYFTGPIVGPQSCSVCLIKSSFKNQRVDQRSVVEPGPIWKRCSPRQRRA